MPIYGANGSLLSTSDYEGLEKKIINGDGFGWPGDDRMWLGVGVIEDRATGKTGRRLEVWRHNEDGTDTIIGHWLPREQHMICYELAQMRADSPGHVPVVERIDAHNKKIEDQRSREYRDHMGALLEHAAHLAHDLNEPKNKFYGIKESLPEEKSKRIFTPKDKD